MSQRALDILSQKLAQGATASDARKDTIAEISLQIGAQARHRSLEDALHSAGFAPGLAAEIRSIVRGATPAQFTAAIQIVIGGGGAGGIPTAECLNRHLPPDREPTDDEIAAAIKACSPQAAVQAF